MTPLRRGDVWIAYVGAVTGAEQTGTRPVLIVSSHEINEGPYNHVLVLPLTTSEAAVESHVRLVPPDGGVLKESFIMCEHIRGLPKARLVKRWGTGTPDVLNQVDGWLRELLGF